MKKKLRQILRFVWKFLRIIIVIILIPILLYVISWTYHRVYASMLSEKSRWVKDLNRFEKILIEKHVNTDWISAGVSYNIHKKIDSLQQAISKSRTSISKDSIRVAMMEISALLKDGHTHIANYIDDTGDIPITVRFFKDGLFITASSKSLKHLIGQKIVTIDGIEISNALNKIRPICPSSNESSQKMYFEIYIKKPGLLYGLGVTSNNKSVTFGLENESGKITNVLLNGFGKEKVSVFLADLNPNNLPLHLKNAKKAYWYEYNAETAMLYLKYNKVLDMDNDPMNVFVDRLMKFADSVDIKKFVIDIRNNVGGDNFLTAKLVSEIQRRPKINKTGVLYVITGHQTFSAAICFAGNLSTRTRATFVGVPFADYNNLPGDANFFDFNMNRITWQVSALFWENTYYKDMRKTILPYIPYESSFREDRNGENPLIKLILNHEPVSDSLNRRKFSNQNSIQSYNGRYRFSPDKTLNLDIKNGMIKISGLIESDLTFISDSVFRATNLQLNFIIKNKQLIVQADDATERILEKLNDHDFTALELIEMGKYTKAREKYLELKKQFGLMLPAISANNLCTAANYLYLGTGKNEMQIELLKIAIEMYPDEMMPLGRMSTAMAINNKKWRSFFYRMKSLWYFDWKNIDNYAKSFGFL